MSACTIDVVKMFSKYCNVPVGSICYNTDKVLTAILDKKSVEGFASILLRIASKTDQKMSQVQKLHSYQWLEHLALYADQAAENSTFAKGFLTGLNKHIEKNSYITGSLFTPSDVAVYYILWPILDSLSFLEKESYIHLCRWSKHIQTLPRVCSSKKPLQLHAIALHAYAPVSH